jgi:hypothetical protein
MLQRKKVNENMDANSGSEFYNKVKAIILFAIIITIPAIYNGFPFLFQDSGDYLSSTARIYRLPVYGSFARIGIAFNSVWAIVAAQALILSHLIYYINQSIFGKTNFWFFLLQGALLTALSSLPYFSSFVMADIFTSILFLTLYLLVFHSNILPKFTKYYFWGLAVFASMAHITNIYLGLGILLFGAMFSLLRSEFALKTLRPFVLPVGLIAIAASSIIGLNAIYFKAWTMSPASPVFTLANLVSQGSARTYIINACPQAKFRICKFAKALPTDVNEFLWSRRGVLRQMSGFTNYRLEAKVIVKNTIAKYPQEVAMHFADYFRQSFFTHAPAVELNSSVVRDRIHIVLSRYYDNYERDAFLKSKQGNDELPYDIIRAIDDYVFPISLIAITIMALALLRRSNDNRYLLPLFTLVFVLGNNFVCSAASGLFDRYQARVSWLMVFATILMLGAWVKHLNDSRVKVEIK